MHKKWVILSSVSFSVGFVISLILSKNIRSATLTGLISLPATAAGILVIENQRKQRLNDEISFLAKQIEIQKQKEAELDRKIFLLSHQTEESKQQKTSLEESISKATAHQQKLQNSLNQLQVELAELQTQVLTQQSQKKELEKAISLLNTQHRQLEQHLQKLRNQETELNRYLATISDEKREAEISFNSCQNHLSEIQNQITTQQQQKIILEENLAVLETQKQTLTTELEHQQQSICDLQQQELLVDRSVKAILAQKEQLETDCHSLQDQISQLQFQISIEQEKAEDYTKIATQKKQLEREIDQLNAQFQQQKAELEQLLTQTNFEKQQLRASLCKQHEQFNQLQGQISTQQTLKAELDCQLIVLEEQKSQLEIFLSILQEQIQNLKQQKVELDNFLLNRIGEKQQTENSLNLLKIELTGLETLVSQLQQRKEELEAEIKQLQIQTLADRQTEPIKDSESTIPNPVIKSKSILPSILQSKPESPPKTTNDKSINNSEQKKVPKTARNEASTLVRLYSVNQFQLLRNDGNDNFMNPEYTKQLWENQILPYWSHRDRPTGHRFLGSVRLDRSKSDELLSTVGQNIKRLEYVTEKSIYDNFYESEQNWLKILTFALSEYAYYYSSDKFWQGFCGQLDIKHNQGVENTLRQVIDRGIDLLGLVRAKGGYKYVSTLWLQSGVPHQNLEHFARLVQEIADEYGWWELAHTSAEDIAQELLQWCTQKYPQWGTLKHFLDKSSCSEEEETEPISGQLVQGIALIAEELERRQVSPTVLKDENQREKLLGNNYLPENFFLRDWNALIQVLTPRSGSNRRGIASRRGKPIYLYLDVTDSLNTQLILPEQVLWKREWQNLRETYCKIPEANWESSIPREGDLQIPELAIDIKQVSDRWIYQLQNRDDQPLQTWQYEGINTQFPCLIFDAIAGNHLSINPTNPQIFGVEEIICFTSREVETEFDNGIEIIDNYIPSSIKGWQGKHLRLVKLEALILLKFTEEAIISWQLREAQQPQLQGLRLKGKKIIYIEAPTFWYPPHQQNINLNILIEDITKRTIISQNIETLTPNNNWFEIKLSQWIIEPSQYEAKFWFEQQQWLYRFEVRSKYLISNFNKFQQLKIVTQSGDLATNFPIKYNNSEKFWSEIITFKELYPLEEVIFILNNNNEQVSTNFQADNLGALIINVSALYDLLSESDNYTLNYQRSGSEPQQLLKMDITPQVINWIWHDRYIDISGLQNGKLHSLSCWNLLLPNKESVIIKIPLVESNSSQVTVPLALPPGIYHIQLYSSQQLIKNIGIWCGSERYDLPEEIYDDEDLANYCYTILDNESVDIFLDEVKKLDLDLSIEQLNLIVSSFEDPAYYHLPKWIELNSLFNKLESLLKFLSQANQIKTNIQDNFQQIIQKNDKTQDEYNKMIEEKWYLVTVQAKKRKLFLECLKNELIKKQLDDLIIDYKTPQDSVLEDIVLVCLSDFKLASLHLKNNPYYQRIEVKPLKSEEVRRMLGDK